MKGEIKPLQVGKISGRGTPSKEPKGPTELKQDSTIRRNPKAPPYYGKTGTSWSGKK